MERQGRWRVGVGGGEASFPHTKNNITKTGILRTTAMHCRICAEPWPRLFKRVRLQEKFLQEKHDSNAVVSMRVAVTKAKLHAKNTVTRV